VLLWPLVVYNELIQRMYTGFEPILMKLDYSMKGDTEHRKHDKRSECFCDTLGLQILASLVCIALKVTSCSYGNACSCWC